MCNSGFRKVGLSGVSASPGQGRYEKREGGLSNLKYRGLGPAYLPPHSYL